MFILDRFNRAASPSAGVAATEMSSWEWCTNEQGSSSLKSKLSTRGRNPIATQASDLIVKMWRVAGRMVAESRNIYIYRAARG